MNGPSSVYIIKNDASSGAMGAHIQSALSEYYDVSHHAWNSIPGRNFDPKHLLLPTAPIVTVVNEGCSQTLSQDLMPIVVNEAKMAKRQPILFVLDDGAVLPSVLPLMNESDDFIIGDFSNEEIHYKVANIIKLTDALKKYERDLKEASDIALLSMSHSSELGEISRFILRSYHCRDYESLLDVLFETLDVFFLQCSALIIVHDTICVKGAEGVDIQTAKDKMLKYHDVKRIVDMGKEVIVSYEHISLMVHNMPIDDEARCGRLLDNLAMLSNCFEARVKAIHAELEADAASRAKTMFLATMSHELRTPMNSVIGFAQRLIKKLDGRLNEREERQLEAIKRNGDHLLSLINDILDMSKIEVGQMEIFAEQANVVELVEQVFTQLQPIASNHQLELFFNTDLTSLDAEVDTKRFTQIVMNLVSNAIKYTEKGSVTIEVTPYHDDMIFEGVGIAVRDTGIGISEADREKLFGDFVQIDSALSRRVEGTGLGLAISMFFAQLHGGKILVESEVGKGSCFMFVLPLLQPEKGEEVSNITQN